MSDVANKADFAECRDKTFYREARINLNPVHSNEFERRETWRCVKWTQE